jgi:DNA-binding transcriptional ArsR family regulator
MKELERILKALANRRRLAIIKFLKKDGEATVGEIANEIRLSFKSTSRHLSVLLFADLLEKDQRGLQMYYKLQSIQKPSARAIINLL